MTNHEQPVAEQLPSNAVHERSSLERFAGLTPSEFVAMTRIVYQQSYDSQTGSIVHTEDVEDFLNDVCKHDVPWAIELFNAFADSPLPEDRMRLAVGSLRQLAERARKDAVSLWNRLMADTDEKVRNTAEELLADDLEVANPAQDGYRGFYTVEAVDEAKLTAETGLTRQDAYDLYLSYAYAENGVYFDLGRVALTKINAIDHPVQ